MFFVLVNQGILSSVSSGQSMEWEYSIGDAAILAFYRHSAG